MSAIQQFSLSALADLMIEEEPDESFMEDDDTHDRSALNATDKSMASTQYSADNYEAEEFEQDESVCTLPPQDTKKEGEEDISFRNFDSLPDVELEAEGSSITGSSAGSGSVLNYSDSQNEHFDSSRTVAAPVNTIVNKNFTLSPIAPSSRPGLRTVNYEDLQEISGIRVDGRDNIEKNSDQDDRDGSFEYNPSHSLEQSSPFPRQNPSPIVLPQTATNIVSSKLAYGRRQKGFSVVTRVSEVEAGRSPGKESDPSCLFATRQSNGGGGDEGQGEHHLGPADINLMREVRRVLTKIEQGEAVTQEVQKAMSRQAVVVEGVHLGSTGTINNASKSRGREQRSVHEQRLFGNSNATTKLTAPDEEDSSGIFSQMSVYDDDDTKDVLVGSSGVACSDDTSHVRGERLRQPESSDSFAPKNPDLPTDAFIIKKRSDVLQKAPGGSKITSRDTVLHIPILSEQYAHLSKLAEETYATFLSDIIEIAQARATAINTGSVEELAMHRALSEHLFSTFAKPNTVEVVRQNMIKAAIAVSPSAGKRL